MYELTITHIREGRVLERTVNGLEALQICEFLDAEEYERIADLEPVRQARLVAALFDDDTDAA